MDEPPRRFAGHPALAGHPHTAVEGERDLVRDEGASLRDPRAPLLDLLTAAERELAVGELDLDSGGPELLEASAVRRGRIELARDDTGHTRGEERVDTRRRDAVMRAGLERDVDRRAACTLAGGLESDDLGVRAALPLVPALAGDLVAGDHHRSDDRVRVRRPATVLGKLERALQEGVLHVLILGRA